MSKKSKLTKQVNNSNLGRSSQLKFSNLEELIKWLVLNADRRKRYWVALNIHTCEMTISNRKPTNSKHLIVKHPNLISKGEKWRTLIRKEFGGFMSKSRAMEYLSKSLIEVIPCDKIADNPHFKCAAPMRLYFVDRVKALAESDKIKYNSINN